MSSLRGIKRREFPISVKKAALARCCRDGIPCCEGCGMQIRGTPYYDHAQADGLGGEPILENCQVLCRTCHSIKTETEDSPRMTKADRVAKKHLGIVSPKQKIASRGFEKRPRQNTASRAINRKQYSTGETT